MSVILHALDSLAMLGTAYDFGNFTMPVILFDYVGSVCGAGRGGYLFQIWGRAFCGFWKLLGVYFKGCVKNS